MDSKKDPYSLRLEKMEMRKSNHFAHFLGSRHMLKFKVPKVKNRDTPDYKGYLGRNWILCGRTF